MMDSLKLLSLNSKIWSISVLAAVKVLHDVFLLTLGMRRNFSYILDILDIILWNSGSYFYSSCFSWHSHWVGADARASLVGTFRHVPPASWQSGEVAATASLQRSGLEISHLPGHCHHPWDSGSWTFITHWLQVEEDQLPSGPCQRQRGGREGWVILFCCCTVGGRSSVSPPHTHKRLVGMEYQLAPPRTSYFL